MRAAGFAASTAGGSATGFRHEALLYSTDDEFVSRTTQFIADGLARDEAVLTVVEAPKVAAIRAALNADAGRVHFADMAEIGRNPALIIQAWRDFVAAFGSEGRAVRGVGEPITAARDEAALAECQIHESLLNIAFADDPSFWLLCPYDTTSLSSDVVDHAVGDHPLVCDRDGHRPGDAHRGGADAGFEWPLPDPDPDPGVDVESMDFAISGLQALRRFVTTRACANGLAPERVGELTTAVSEIATNAIVHGHGDGTARIWRQTSPTGESRVVCEVHGPGHITDPLIGRLRPARGQLHGHGVWLANQFCDLVQIRSTDLGTTVRLQVLCD